MYSWQNILRFYLLKCVYFKSVIFRCYFGQIYNKPRNVGFRKPTVVWLRTAFFYYAVLPGSIEISDNSTVNLKIWVVNFCFAICS